MSNILPSESWPPYRWLWQRVGGRPWTHIMRDHPRIVLPAMLGLLLVLLLWQARAHWRVLLSFGLGFLGGHLWW